MPLMAEGEFALMQEHLEAGLKLGLLMGAAPRGDHDLYAMLVDAAAQRRDPAALQKYAPLAEETARSIDHKLHVAIAYRARGVAHTLAGEYPEAEARLNEALEIFTAYPAPWQIGRNLFEMGELARAQMKTEQARDYFSRALSAFEALGAAPYAVRTRSVLEELSPD
jgi:tetratricopeptide (TPR) repeat protein